MERKLKCHKSFSSLIISIYALIKRLFFSHWLHNHTRPVPTIPSNVCFQILLHLPADSLLRCRAVCKSWRLIIDDPSFIKSHTLKPQSSYSTLLVKDDRRLYYVPTPSSRTDQTLDLTRIESLTGGSFPTMREMPTASCHGLILLFDLSDFNPRAGWVIWNPLNRMWRRLSYTSLLDSSSSFFLEGVGLGYDHTSDDYKVILIRNLHGDRVYGLYRTLVYSLKSGEWKAIQDWPLPSILRRSIGVYLNGALYWLCENSIVVLDLASEVYQLLQLPPQSYEVKTDCISLDVLDGCLFVRYYHMWKNYERLEEYEYDVWMMEGEISDESHETKWIKVLSSKEHGGVGGNGMRPVAYSKRKGEVVMQHGSHFYSFDVRRNSLKKVTVDGFPYFFRCQNFQGSLVRLVDDEGGGGSVRLVVGDGGGSVRLAAREKRN